MAALNFPEGSVESKLLAHMKSQAGPAATTWFELDQVTFATGAAELETASADQVANLAKILAAFPSVRVRVGGYTDATGSPAANQKLSQARADSVRTALIGQGVDGARVEARGYGTQHQVESTSGASQANRRASIRVLSR
jgi:K(+)-stimulated pyrophosphate-energized sodium pump